MYQYQADGSNFRTKETAGKAFTSSCLGKIIILTAIPLVALIIAYFTTPTEKEMAIEMEDNIMECLEANDSIKGDAIDDYVHNMGAIITTADTMAVSEEVRKAYHQLNRLEVHRHTFYATARLINNLKPEGHLVGFGCFGLIVPTVLYSDILLDVGPVHKGYNQKIMQQAIPDTDLGQNPNIQEFHYKRNPDE